jgi:hypothetical protein
MFKEQIKPRRQREVKDSQELHDDLIPNNEALNNREPVGSSNAKKSASIDSIKKEIEGLGEKEVLKENDPAQAIEGILKKYFPEKIDDRLDNAKELLYLLYNIQQARNKRREIEGELKEMSLMRRVMHPLLYRYLNRALVAIDRGVSIPPESQTVLQDRGLFEYLTGISIFSPYGTYIVQEEFSDLIPIIDSGKDEADYPKHARKPGEDESYESIMIRDRLNNKKKYGIGAGWHGLEYSKTEAEKSIKYLLEQGVETEDLIGEFMSWLEYLQEQKAMEEADRLYGTKGIEEEAVKILKEEEVKKISRLAGLRGPLD